MGWAVQVNSISVSGNVDSRRQWDDIPVSSSKTMSKTTYLCWTGERVLINQLPITGNEAIIDIAR